MRLTIHLLILTILMLGLWAVQPSANPDLGLILRYVDEINGRVVLANIFDVKAQSSFEYFVGDHVNGLRLQQILPDRIVLLDEIGKTQYVLVLNGDEVIEDEEVAVTHRRHRKRQMDEMDVTADFNRELSKAEGTYRMFGAVDDQSQLEEQEDLLQKAQPLGGLQERQMKNSPLKDTVYGPEGGPANPFGAAPGKSPDGAQSPADESAGPANPFSPKPVKGKRPAPSPSSGESAPGGGK